MDADMTKEAARAVQPPVLLSADDFSRLTSLANATLAHHPGEDAQLLIGELDRADIVPDGWIPPGVVTMNSYVEFRDDPAGTVRRLQLVYPHQANFKEGRLSVLSQVGAALVGLAEGQSINWRARNGGDRCLTVLRASADPLAEREAVSAETPKLARDPVDLASEGSFPASDPPPWTLG